MGTLRLTIQYIFLDLFGGIIRWPLWWYSKGLLLAFRYALQSVKHYSQTIAILVWMKNLFVPMYGLRDWQGRLISFFVRLAQIFFRSIFLFVYVLIVLFFLALYMALPIFAFVQALYHFSASLL